MKNKLRWGLLSTARINRSLIGPIQASSNSELVAVASRDLKRAQAYAEKRNIPRAFGSYEAMLEDPNVDVIYNALPNALHADWTVQAAESGKHVLCEKPIVTTLDDLDRVEDAARRNDVTIFEGFMYLHHPQTQRAQSLIREGHLGELKLINSWFSFFLPPENKENIRLSAELHGGSMWDVGVYPNSMAIMLTGGEAPVEVWAQQTLGETGVDVRMIGQMRFEHGVIAQIAAGFRMPFRQGTVIVGENAILEIPEPWKPGVNNKASHLMLDGQDDELKTITIPPIDPYLCEVQAMESCVMEDADPIISFETSRTFLRTALALYQSAETGKPVTL
jgi:predicted dehydrogenase